MARKKSRELAVAPKELEGKAASEPKVVRWVARNIDAPDPKAEECPDPFAWTLLKMCREDPGFRVFFVEKLWSKLLPSRSQIDQGMSSGKLDGKVTLELIEKIQRMGGRRDTTGAAGPAVTRAPEPVKDYFAEWSGEGEPEEA